MSHVVEYQVTGNWPVHVTYTDPTDRTVQQEDVSVRTENGPRWAKTWVGGVPPLFMSISVQNEVSMGEVACAIMVDGRVVNTHTASGYNIANCQSSG